uniref:Uncharacterized protein n=1 Tax=Rhizophora mucronata TaxID=61149 RepID=A0A2P2N2V1_RHIMU
MHDTCGTNISKCFLLLVYLFTCLSIKLRNLCSLENLGS